RCKHLLGRSGTIRAVPGARRRLQSSLSHRYRLWAAFRGNEARHVCYARGITPRPSSATRGEGPPWGPGRIVPHPRWSTLPLAGRDGEGVAANPEGSLGGALTSPSRTGGQSIGPSSSMRTVRPVCALCSAARPVITDMAPADRKSV